MQRDYRVIADESPKWEEDNENGGMMEDGEIRKMMCSSDPIERQQGRAGQMGWMQVVARDEVMDGREALEAHMQRRGWSGR